jgi:hypothetical protein
MRASCAWYLLCAYVQHKGICLRFQSYVLWGVGALGGTNDNTTYIHKVREDGRGEVHVAGLELFEVGSAGELHQLIARGNQLRTTQATESNDTSSRSHAICQVNYFRNVCV